MKKKDFLSQKLAEHMEEHYGFSYVAYSMRPYQLVCPAALERLKRDGKPKDERKRKFLKDLHRKQPKPKKRKKKPKPPKMTRKKKIEQFQMIVEEDGQKFYTRKFAAEKAKISFFTIKQYTADGVIPKPIFENELGMGLYSEYQIKLLKKTIGKMSKEEYSAYLYEHWNDELYE